MDLNELAIDPEKQEQGAWVDDIPDMGELRLKVRGLGNADYRRLMAKLVEATPRAKKLKGRIDPVEQDRITSSCLHSTILLDWEGLKVGGQPQPYDKDLAKELLTDPKYRRFRDAVQYAATVVAEDIEEEIEDSAKN